MTPEPIHFPRPPQHMTAAEVWAALEATPGFNEDMREAEADFAAGRYYILDTDTGETRPNPDWPPDGGAESGDDADERRVAQLVEWGVVTRDVARMIVELEGERRWTAVPSRPQGSDDE